MTAQDADDRARELDRRFSALDRRVHVVVNYDGFDLGPDAADPFFAVVKCNEERFLLSSTRYSTNPFFRRQLGREFTEHDLHADFSERPR